MRPEEEEGGGERGMLTIGCCRVSDESDFVGIQIYESTATANSKWIWVLVGLIVSDDRELKTRASQS